MNNLKDMGVSINNARVKAEEALMEHKNYFNEYKRLIDLTFKQLFKDGKLKFDWKSSPSRNLDILLFESQSEGEVFDFLKTIFECDVEHIRTDNGCYIRLFKNGEYELETFGLRIDLHSIKNQEDFDHILGLLGISSRPLKF